MHHSTWAVSDGTLVLPGMIFPQFTHFGIVDLFLSECFQQTNMICHPLKLRLGRASATTGRRCIATKQAKLVKGRPARMVLNAQISDLRARDRISSPFTPLANWQRHTGLAPVVWPTVGTTVGRNPRKGNGT